MTSKTIKHRHPAVRDDIADLTTRRPVPGVEIEQVDPFLFLNHHGPQVYPPRNRGLPFGPHPHRGFETVTFILTGELAHRDSAGHESIIREGGIQWMTAGSGLVHAEVSPDGFMRKGGPLEILQLWVNLPPRLKMTTPRYIGLQQSDIPAITTPDGKGTVHLTSGEYLGQQGAMQPLLDIFLGTVELQAGGKVSFPGVKGRNVFLYVVRGEIAVAGADRKLEAVKALGAAAVINYKAPGADIAAAVKEGSIGGVSIQKPYSVPCQRMNSSHMVVSGMPVLQRISRS